MFQPESWLLRGLLGFICLLPVCMSAAPDSLCVSLETVRDRLNSTLRRRFMKVNFPINYTIQVHYEEVFRLRNISRLRSEEEKPELEDLQTLWILISKKGIQRVLSVLPERHPTRRKYLSDLENLFTIFEQIHGTQNPPNDTRELPESIRNIQDHLKDPHYQGWKSVTPKSILDNCYRTMHCLFKECFTKEGSEHDYCDFLNWRKAKMTT